MPVEASRRTAVACPPSVAQDLGYLLAVLAEHVEVLRAADPTGRLWAACVILRREAQRCGVAAPLTRRARAHRKRRLGELAEHAGDHGAAIRYYRAALALLPGVGVQRRLAQLQATTRRAGRRRR